MNPAMPENAGKMPWMQQGHTMGTMRVPKWYISIWHSLKPRFVSEFFRYCNWCKLDDFYMIWYDLILVLSYQGSCVCRNVQFGRDIRDIRKSTLAFYLHGVTNLTKCFRSCIQDTLLIRPWPWTTGFKRDKHGASMHALILLVSFSDKKDIQGCINILYI